ncbi:MAG: hypothetical protein HFJ30_03430 [Clostridia bacterium]|jgi:Na+-transporting NADH:ubiquinone oxidoreductase subunit NqrC|nr:hypothetical protein [Clostridia bacterium]
MKKVIFMIIIILAIAIVATLLVVQNHFNKKAEELKKEEEILNTFDLTTKSGKAVELGYMNFENGEFYLKLPKEFKLMDAKTLKKKYANENPPTFAYTNEETTVNVAVSITNTQMSNEAIGTFLESMKAQLGAQYEVLESRTKEKEGHTIGQIQFISKAPDTDIYNHMMIFSCNDKFRTVSFNCTKELQEEWQEVGAFIINSLIFSQD